MKKPLTALVLVACAAATSDAIAESPYPPLRDGDLIFQTSTSRQSAAILVATADRFSHMGIIKHDGGSVVVIEAAGQVKETPLQALRARGRLPRSERQLDARNGQGAPAPDS